MIETRPRILELKEFNSFALERDALSRESLLLLNRDYDTQVKIETSLFGDIKLNPQGWVGYIPLDNGEAISLQPKVELGNLFRMLEYAYDVNFRILEGDMTCQTLTEFYERLANVLAKRVLARARRGFYRAYIPMDEQLPYVRGRVDMRKAVQSPWDIQLQCHFQEHTGDIEDNQILAWTLYKIAHVNIFREDVLATVRAAYRSLHGLVSNVPYSAEACLKRLYHRLNSDYEPMHGLCRFFLEHTGPSHSLGDRKMIPFLIGMAPLFEKFVAQWLIQHLPPRYKLKAQEHIDVSDDVLNFNIDLVIYDVEEDKVLYVLDTKYKKSTTPSNADINQVVTYAQLKNTNQAVLIYPTAEIHPLNTMIGDTCVRSAAFNLERDLDEAGKQLMNVLGLDF